MLKKKINLICYKASFLRNSHSLVMPNFVGAAFYLYNGKKYELLALTSRLFSFFRFSDFITSSKRFGPIHNTSKKKSNLKSKKKK